MFAVLWLTWDRAEALCPTFAILWLTWDRAEALCPTFAVLWLTWDRAEVGIAGRAVGDILQQFVLRKFTSHANPQTVNQP